MGNKSVDVLRVTEPDGTVKIEVEQGDYVRIHYLNTYSGDEDSVEGFATRIRPSADRSLLELDDGTAAHIPDGDIRIDDRRYGKVLDVDVIEENNQPGSIR
jgi:hypothetical protein